MIVSETELHDLNTIASAANNTSVTAISSNDSIFNSKDIVNIVEWSIIGTMVGILINRVFRGFTK